MPKLRKKSDDYDETTEQGREGLSLLRNRGADGVVKYVQEYQEASQHKVVLFQSPCHLLCDNLRT